jgi:CRISPR/Cas system-associated exonuclease Cas4 (RecB family)
MKFSPYSPSRLESAVCGFSFIKTYGVKERPRNETIASSRGSVIHEVFERISLARIVGQEQFTPEEINRFIIEAVKRYPAAYAETTSIMRMCSLYLRRLPKLEKHTRVEVMLGIDAQGNECDYEDPKAFLRGRADLLMFSDDGEYATLIDYKTQRNKEDADTFQLGVYAYILSKMYPFLKEINTILYFAQIGVSSDTYTWTKEDLKFVEQDIHNRVAMVEEREVWGALPNHKCNYCQHHLICPVLENIIVHNPDGSISVKKDNLKILGDHSKAVYVAQILAVLEPMVSDAKSDLKKYVEINGPIAVFGKEYGAQQEIKADWDAVNKNPELMDKVCEILERHGENPDNFKKFSQTHASKMWVIGKPKMIEELAATIPTETVSTVRWRKL